VISDDKLKNSILKLLMSPIDIHGYEELYNYLSEYFKNASDVKNICLINNFGETSKKHGTISNLKALSGLENVSDIPVDYFNFRTFLDSSETIMAAPIYYKNEEYDWLVIELKDKGKSEYINDYLFKYLANINLFREHKENVEDLIVLASTDDVTGLYNQRKLAEEVMLRCK